MTNGANGASSRQTTTSTSCSVANAARLSSPSTVVEARARLAHVPVRHVVVDELDERARRRGGVVARAGARPPRAPRWRDATGSSDRAPGDRRARGRRRTAPSRSSRTARRFRCRRSCSVTRKRPAVSRMHAPRRSARGSHTLLTADEEEPHRIGAVAREHVPWLHDVPAALRHLLPVRRRARGRSPPPRDMATPPCRRRCSAARRPVPWRSRAASRTSRASDRRPSAMKSAG